MKKSIIITLLLVCMGLIISGCTGNGNNEETSFNPYNGGTEGLFLEFQEGAPPDEIYDNEQYPFTISLKVENRGEYDFDPTIDFGQVSLIGFNPDYFGLTNTVKPIDFELEGKKKNFDGTVIDGDVEYITYDELNYKLDLQGNDLITVRAEACYDYHTSVSTKICIKENAFDKNDDDICRVNEVKSPKNSGAPVHVTSLSELPMGKSKIQILFTVGHVGAVSGQIYKLGGQCDDSVTNVDKNKVYTKVSLPQDTDATITCPRLSGNAEKTEGYVTLYQGEPAVITCTIETAGTGKVYEPILTIGLDYLYGDYIDKQINVLDVSTG